MAEVIHHYHAIRFHALLILVHSSPDHREVQIKYEVLVMALGGMLANPQVAKESVEERGFAHVVVLTQHVHQQRLAEAARTDEEEIVIRCLYLGDEAGLIDIVVVREAYVLPVLHPVGDSFGFIVDHVLWRVFDLYFQISMQRYAFIEEYPNFFHTFCEEYLLFSHQS